MPPNILDLRNKAVPTPEEKTSLPPPEPTSLPPTILQWEAWEFPEEKVKSRESLMRLVLIFGIPLGALFLLLKNILGAVIVFLGGIMIVFEFSRKPRRMTFAIERDGITVNKKPHPYKELLSFWIFENPSKPALLSVKTKKVLGLHLRVPLENVDPKIVRDVLRQFLPEEKQQPSAFDQL